MGTDRLTRMAGLLVVLLLAAGASGSMRAAEEREAPKEPPKAEEEDAQAKARKLLEEEAARRKLKEEERQALAQHFAEVGKKLYEAFDHEAARVELEKALQLDPSNEEARKYLVKVNEALGRRQARIKAAAERLPIEARVRVQEQLAQLDNRLDWAQRFLREAREGREELMPREGKEPVKGSEIELVDRVRKYERAIEALERAREIIRWLPFDVDTTDQQALVSRLMKDARNEKKETELALKTINRLMAEKAAAERRDAEARFTERRIAKLVDQAKHLYEMGKFEEAEKMAGKILAMDPENADAHAIEVIARDQKHINAMRSAREDRREQYISSTEYIEASGIPHREYLVYPPDWHEKARREAEEERQRVMPAWQQEIMRRMARKVSFDFVDTPLSEVIAFLTSLTRVNIILDPKAAQEGADKAPITLRVREMELETALRWILRLANLDYDLRNQAVFISSRKHLGSTLELEVYDVRDLTMTIENFPGPRIDLGVAGAGAAVGGGAPPAPPAGGGEVMDAASLAALIREKLAPNAWAEETGASIQDRGGRLIVMQRPEIHALIKQLLRTFRETQTLQVVVQVRFVDVREAFLEQIGVHLTGLDAPLGDTGVPNAKVDPNPLNQPSSSGLYPMGGGPNTTTTPPSDIQPMLPAWQRPAFPIFAPPITPRGNPGSPIVLHPRLDPNYPRLGSVATVGPALDPVGIRRQQYSKTLGSPMLWMGEAVNLTRGQPLNPTVAPLGPQLVNRPDQGALFQFRYLGPLQVNAILQALKQEQNADQLLAPKLTMFNNQQAHVMVTQQRAYISDYDVSGAVFDPQITSFMTGVVLEVRPTVSHDRRYITLEMKPGTAVEVTPPQIIYITNGGNVNLPQGSINLPIELPNLELRSISTTATVPDGGTLLLSGMIHDEKMDSKTGIPVLADIPVIGRVFSKNYKEIGRRNLVVMVNARLILFDEEEAKL